MDKRGTFTQLLKNLAATCKGNISVLELFSRCVNAIISDLAEDLEHLFTADNILQNFSIYNIEIASEIRRPRQVSCNRNLKLII